MDSTSGLSASILSGTKFKIQQSVPSGSIKRGPHTIVRTADLNDGIEIKRRFGEGSKPLFADIPIQQAPIDSHDLSFGCKSKSNRKSSSTDTSSPERYRHRENKKHSPSVSNRRKSPPRFNCKEKTHHIRDKHTYNSKFESSKTEKYRRRENSNTRSPSPVKKKPAQKLPYYRDEQREKDRLRRLYGRSRSRSPLTSVRKGSPSARRRIESPPRRRRSTSRERQHGYSPHRSSRRDHRRQRSRSTSKTRSPHRNERRKHLNRDADKEQKEDLGSLAAAVIPATPQYIPIPVPVPADYSAYSFPGWTSPQPPWHPNSHRPPPASHFVPFPIWPMIPPIRPPHQASFAGMPPSLAYSPMTQHYRPYVSQRYPPPRHSTSNYQSRPKKPSM